MQDIQFNKSISKEEWEALHHTYIDEWDFIMPVRNVLMRHGCRTIGDVIDMSDKELQTVIETIRNNSLGIAYKNTFQGVVNYLKKQNITLPTEEEKQSILDSLSEEEKLKREIRILKFKNERLEEQKYYVEERIERLIQIIQEDEKQILEKTRRIIAKNKNPLPIILRNMVYRNSNINLCSIFNLYEKRCRMEENYGANKSLNDCCEKCIAEFLLKYDVEQRKES